MSLPYKAISCIVFPGVWIGPLQKEPGESHERPGICADQLTGYVDSLTVMRLKNRKENGGNRKRV